MAVGEQKEFDGDDEKRHLLNHASNYHIPVLCNAVVKGLITDTNGIYVDGTLGGGGHAEAILSHLGPDGRLIGIDRDEESLEVVAARLDRQIKHGQMILVAGNFADLSSHLEERQIDRIDGLLLDLGVSSHQLDVGTRGFSYQREGPLDMRMGRDTEETALQVLNEWEERDLVQMFRRYGEEPRARRIGSAVVANRPLNSTFDLGRVISATVHRAVEAKTLARVFQAIRIAVNNELEALETALRSSNDVIGPGGRLVVISYHSLEDRRVKRFLRSGNFEGELTRDLYGNRQVPWEELTRHPVRASDAEQKMNPRSRSARLRYASRTTYNT